MISIIIPIYNADNYLFDTIECLQKQTYADFEVLLINDGSTDHSADICEEIAKSDTRFKYVYQENQGVSAARNLGLVLSKGETITFIDADDHIPSNYLEVLYYALISNNCQMSICDVAIITDKQEVARFTLPSQQLTQQQTLNYLLSRTNINSGPYAKLFRREVLNGITFPSLKTYEDILFVVEAICQCKQIAVTNSTEYRYIQNAGSAMSTFVKMPSKDILTASKKLLDFTISRTDLASYCYYITASHLMQYVLLLAPKKDRETREFISAAKVIFSENKRNILACSAFPWKEKIVYILFSCGWLYHGKKITRI